ncbi:MULTISPECIES: hypothetical protein [unclassified Haladaptatus]|uniref:hypothetical protein n=1 Tax=unclassified Haladaptatus TaxID=2622732 RepID=UPI0023E85F96|nr:MULTISPECIES: hypothetical protein [unclassified Haladaptatus]
MPHNNHHRCNLCGRDFSNHATLTTHLKRRHPREEARWWVVSEHPENLQFEY